MRTTGFSLAIERALPQGSEEAWVLLSDIDEIPRAAILHSMLFNTSLLSALEGGATFTLEGTTCYYTVDCCAPAGSREASWLAGPKLLTSEHLRRTSWERIRRSRVSGPSDPHVVRQASWHFGFLMSSREQLTKVCLSTDPIVRQSCARGEDAVLAMVMTIPPLSPYNPTFGSVHVRLTLDKVLKNA